MTNNKNKKVLLIIPSTVMAKGMESILSEMGEFSVAGILSEMPGTGDTKAYNVDADVVIVDPMVLDHASRAKVRGYLDDFPDAAVIALVSTAMDEDSLKPYDDIINVYDKPVEIIKKLRRTLEVSRDSAKTGGEELSSREKEILVCVAQGMLNKEIADKFNLSIYTVITHRKNITRKTGIKTVAGLTVYAMLNNLIDINLQ